MKKVLASIITIITINSLIYSTSYAYEKTSFKKFKSNPYEYYCLKTSEDVNIRIGPGLKYPVYKVLPKDTIILLINDEDPSGWYETWYDNNSYFIYGDYVKFEVYDPENTELPDFD